MVSLNSDMGQMKAESVVVEPVFDKISETVAPEDDLESQELMKQRSSVEDDKRTVAGAENNILNRGKSWLPNKGLSLGRPNKEQQLANATRRQETTNARKLANPPSRATGRILNKANVQ